MEKNNEMQVLKSEHLQMIPIAQAQGWYNDFVAFSKSILKTDLDFGIIPGTPKPSLYKPGAEKLRFVYGLGVEMACIDKTVDLDRLFVDYTYCASVRSKTGQILAQCEGSCNSMEPKYGYLWKTINELPEGIDTSKLQSKSTGKKQMEFDFAINKAETTGQYGKPKEYWDNWKEAIQAGRAKKGTKAAKTGRVMDTWELDETVTVYRITNPDVIGMKNTIMKMAQKRAFVGAILIATGASEFFTQDVEDMEIHGTIYSNEHPVPDGEFTHSEVVSDSAPAEAPQPAKPVPAKTVPISEPSPTTARIAGSWYAKLERCKTAEDVDALAISNKETIMANPELRKLFNQTKADLKAAV